RGCLVERRSLPLAFEYLREQVEENLTPLPNPRETSRISLAGRPNGGREASSYAASRNAAGSSCIRVPSSASRASSTVTCRRRKLRSANLSHAVSAPDRRPCTSRRYQCSHSWRYTNRSTSRRVRNRAFSDSQANFISAPGLRLALM